MLLGSGRHSRRRGGRRRRAEAAADAAAARLFPLTTPGLDDAWDQPAPVAGEPVPWWLDVDEDEAGPAAVPATAAAHAGRPEAVAVIDRYSPAYDLPYLPPGTGSDQEVGGPAANSAAMPDLDGPSRPVGDLGSADEPEGDAGGWAGEPGGDVPEGGGVPVAATDGDVVVVDPWAAGDLDAGWLDPTSTGADAGEHPGVVDEDTVEHDLGDSPRTRLPSPDGGGAAEDPLVGPPSRSADQAADPFDTGHLATAGGDGRAVAGEEPPAGEPGARRFVFVEAATRYATGDEDPGSDDGPSEDPDPDDDDGHRYEDEHLTAVYAPAASAPPPRSGGRRRAVLAAVPVLVVAAAGAVWAATASPDRDPSPPAERVAAAPETTTTTAGSTFGLSVVAPPVTVAPPPTEPPTTTTLPWANRTPTTLRPPTTATTAAPTTTAAPPPVPTTPPTVPATTATTTAPAATTPTPPTAPPTTATTTATTTSTTTTTEPPTTTSTPTAAEPPPGTGP